jgi:uncharacterized membrane protein
MTTVHKRTIYKWGMSLAILGAIISIGAHWDGFLVVDFILLAFVLGLAMPKKYPYNKGERPWPPK